MKKLISYLGIISLAVFVASCRPEVNDPKSFPTADSFSPGIAKTGDTVKISGSYLEGSAVLLDGKEVELSSSSDRTLAFVVTDELTASKDTGVFDLCVRFGDGSSSCFGTPIVLNYEIQDKDKLGGWLASSSQAVGDTLNTGPAQLLITDYDGHGVRTADFAGQVADFDQTQFEGQVQTGGSMVISSGFLGTPTSPANGNYFAVQLNPEFVLENTSGHVGETTSRSELQNDRATVWPVNFTELPESPLVMPTSNSGLENLYLNFYVFRNSKEKGKLRATLFNDDLSLSKQFSHNVAENEGLGEWKLVSIPLRASPAANGFLDGFGFGVRLSVSSFRTINKIKFSFSHADKADNQTTAASGDVQFYIDHVMITQGGPYLGYKRSN